ncbi:hypothetical protein BDK51DRAFT_33747 [Blyttiomyces helicus]|uniref:Uncharacterized protein n=1 Tax=Blyttiomyces helicus TaxID=388810 RepID=A0A4V1IQH2_9FUNG|nr:hypothetical protein BDK51DRAFT_33747 [Blyttiomyces helicus]|eukprot:RKO86547.1 hypothetical protein BDK51DRAFT_33747 [Blyttiomyces helicus]
MASESTQITLAYVFTGIGFAIQLANVTYGMLHAVRKPTRFNLVLAISLVMYAFSFVPLLLTTNLCVEVAHRPDHWKFARLDALVRTYDALYSLATLVYLLLVQVRFRVIKSLMPYKDIYDWIFVFTTIAIWSSTALLFGVLTTQTSNVRSTLMAIWTVYALVQPTANRLRDWTRVVGALCALCVITWIGLAVLLIDNLYFDKEPATKSLMFRVAFACTPLDFSGALIFIYTVRRLMGQAAAPARVEPVVDAPRKVRVGALEKGLVGAGPGVLRSVRRTESKTGLLTPTSPYPGTPITPRTPLPVYSPSGFVQPPATPTWEEKGAYGPWDHSDLA